MSPLARLLAIDCATLPASLALVDETGVRAGRVQQDERRTDAWIGLAVAGCLEEAGVSVGQLDGIAVCVGPGTFTGIRVGIATALGLAAPRSLPIAAVTSLAALADVGAGQAATIAACIDARRGQVYAALYRAADGAAPTTGATAGAPLWGPVVCAPEEVDEAIARHGGDVLALGSGASLLSATREGLTVAAGPWPLAEAIGRLARQRWEDEHDPPADWPFPEPVYLRPPDAKPPRNPLLDAR